MNLLGFLFKERRAPFMKAARAALVVSALLMVASVAVTVVQGLNLGVDFTGGANVQVQTGSDIDLAAARAAIAERGYAGATVSYFGAPNEILIQLPDDQVESAGQAIADMRAAMQTLYDDVEIRSSDIVYPQVSAELFRSAALALGLAMAAIVIYIWFRFEWQFSLGAVAALIHDVTLTIGIFSALQLEFDLPIVAALLTIIGYSLNDTVVVYDRVREQLRKYKSMDLGELLDLSVSQTLPRTLMTSITTLIALGALFILGGPVLRGFTFAMIWGVVVGTYSSIFVAAPILRFIGVKREALLDPKSETP